MKIGVPREIKDSEARVGMTPDGVAKLVKQGNTVVIEAGAGLGSGFTDEQYRQAGAVTGLTAEAWATDLVVKVKEPQEAEYCYLRKQMVFAFFHFAGVTKSLTKCLLESGTTAIAYELLEDENGLLPILAPMSAVAGNMSVLMGAYYLARFNKGNGMQLGAVLGKSYGEVLIIGDGVVGQHASMVASAMGAGVTVAGIDEARWVENNKKLSGRVAFIESNKENILTQIADADLVVGAVHSKGVRAKKSGY